MNSEPFDQNPPLYPFYESIDFKDDTETNGLFQNFMNDPLNPSPHIESPLKEQAFLFESPLQSFLEQNVIPSQSHPSLLLESSMESDNTVGPQNSSNQLRTPNKNLLKKISKSSPSIKTCNKLQKQSLIKSNQAFRHCHQKNV